MAARSSSVAAVNGFAEELKTARELLWRVLINANDPDVAFGGKGDIARRPPDVAQ
jgi:hypothetical protein